MTILRCYSNLNLQLWKAKLKQLPDMRSVNSRAVPLSERESLKGGDLNNYLFHVVSEVKGGCICVGR
jgi:hypothetical protein